MNGPQPTTRHKRPFSGTHRYAFGPWVFVVCGITIAACTLTSDEFVPHSVELRQNLPDQDAGADPATAPDSQPVCTDPRGCCEVDQDCGPDAICSSGVCEVSSCVDVEDVSACEVALCPGPNCPLPPPEEPPPEVPPTCDDGEQNGTEAGPDCGQTCPLRCEATVSCAQDLDCASFNCDGGSCTAATCEDNITNQDETDTDCGGICPTPCAAGEDCAADADCGADLFCPTTTLVCTNNSCQDGVQSGSEILADCGGGECPGCIPGTACGEDADCDSGVCGVDGECAAPTCNDDEQNQTETDVDCGGICNETCATGDACNNRTDCQSDVCTTVGCPAGTATCCQAPACNDGVRNGTEPVVDCGNQTCGLCAVGRPCTANAQCQTRICTNSTCQPLPPCANLVRNGTESDVDCGGTDPSCSRCADGRICNGDNDCASDNCAGGRCVSCNDNAQNGGETDLNCGGNGTGCVRCPNGDGCTVDGDCASGNCNAGTCVNFNCRDNTRNGNETGVDCGGTDPECGNCADGVGCAQDGDCINNNCVNSVCISCGDNVQNGTETGIDCGGSDPACRRCNAGEQCSIDSDCTNAGSVGNGACQDGRCCGGNLGNCTRCAERISTANCTGASDATGVTNCNNYLQCLRTNTNACPTAAAGSCTCDRNSFGGPGGTGVAQANNVLISAFCQL